MKGQFKVRSLESIGTIDRDMDVGVIRVPGTFLRRFGKRNSLVKISLISESGKRKTIVRIVRAATGSRALLNNEIALQYDDRRKLGIKKAGTIHTLEIRAANEWLSLPAFLLGHPSPLVRREAAFAVALMFVGAVVGFVAGISVL